MSEITYCSRGYAIIHSHSPRKVMRKGVAYDETNYADEAYEASQWGSAQEDR